MGGLEAAIANIRILGDDLASGSGNDLIMIQSGLMIRPKRDGEDHQIGMYVGIFGVKEYKVSLYQKEILYSDGFKQASSGALVLHEKASDAFPIHLLDEDIGYIGIPNEEMQSRTKTDLETLPHVSYSDILNAIPIPISEFAIVTGTSTNEKQPGQKVAVLVGILGQADRTLRYCTQFKLMQDNSLIYHPGGDNSLIPFDYVGEYRTPNMDFVRQLISQKKRLCR